MRDPDYSGAEGKELHEYRCRLGSERPSSALTCTWTPILIEWIQGTTKISTRLIFGALLDLTQLSPSQASDNLTLTATSPYGRQIPLSKHPAQETLDKPSGKCTFQYKAEDRIFEERNRRRAERKSTAFNDSGLSETPDCGLEWGTWLELQDPDDVLEIAMIPFFSDCMKNLPSLLPQELRPGPTYASDTLL